MKRRTAIQGGKTEQTARDIAIDRINKSPLTMVYATRAQAWAILALADTIWESAHILASALVAAAERSGEP